MADDRLDAQRSGPEDHARWSLADVLDEAATICPVPVPDDWRWKGDDLNLDDSEDAEMADNRRHEGYELDREAGQ